MARIRVLNISTTEILVSDETSNASVYLKEFTSFSIKNHVVTMSYIDGSNDNPLPIFTAQTKDFVEPKEVSPVDLMILLNDTLRTQGEGTGTVIIKSLGDFPDPVNGIIYLSTPNTVYKIDGEVNTGDNVFIVVASGVYFSGQSNNKDKIISTATGSVITTTNYGFRAENITIKADNATEVFTIKDNNTERFILDKSLIDTTGKLGTLDTLAEAYIDLTDFINYTSGFTFTNLVNIIRVEKNITNSFTGIFIDLIGSTSEAITISDNVATLAVGGTFLKIEPLGANMVLGGEGDILSNNIDLTAGGTAIVGYTGFEAEWATLGNSNISDSDRIEPAGWANYQDGETTPATQTITTTPVKLLIDGLGAATEEAYLPLSIRGSSSLWDTANDCIVPILEGDSYDVRVVLDITGKSGTPTLLTMELDIGGGVAPTISIVTDDRSTSKTPPFSLVFTFPIFTLATFIANGGQFFLSVNTGTYTIGGRSVYIARTSPGSI
jgi:hypothetical protein